ncbi:MAG TPA: hypothetical protein PLF50_06030 [Candidatus Cloacimonadota bacterium]|nr:hypothetical protein [Candidatus Cloacimonadota bacterium]
MKKKKYADKGEIMSGKLFLLVSLLLILFCQLTAQEQTLNLSSLINVNSFIQNDSLTNSLTVLAHLNWSQIGVAASYKHVILMYNKTVFPLPKNYKSDVSTSVLNGMDESYYDISYSYDNIIAGYLIKIGKNFYPYAGTGTATSAEMIKIDDPTDNEGVYTIKGKEVTYGTGIAGFFLRFRKNLVLEASCQFKPLLPFVGMGYVF